MCLFVTRHCDFCWVRQYDFSCGRHCEVCCDVTVNYVCDYSDNVVNLVVNWILWFFTVFVVVIFWYVPQYDFLLCSCSSLWFLRWSWSSLSLQFLLCSSLWSWSFVVFVTTIFFCVRHDNFLLCCVRLCDFLLCLSLQFFDVFVAVSFCCGRHCECEVCCGVTVNYVCGYTDNVVHLVCGELGC